MRFSKLAGWHRNLLHIDLRGFYFEKLLHFCYMRANGVKNFQSKISYCISKIFVQICIFLALSMSCAIPSLGKNNSYYSNDHEAAYTTAYEPEQHRHNYKKAEYHYPQSGYYIINYIYHLWNWLWYNIIFVIIIAIVVWYICRAHYRCLIDKEFHCAETSLPPGGDVGVSNVAFMLRALRNSLPV